MYGRWRHVPGASQVVGSMTAWHCAPPAKDVACQRGGTPARDGERAAPRTSSLAAAVNNSYNTLNVNTHHTQTTRVCCRTFAAARALIISGTEASALLAEELSRSSRRSRRSLPLRSGAGCPLRESNAVMALSWLVLFHCHAAVRPLH